MKRIALIALLIVGVFGPVAYGAEPAWLSSAPVRAADARLGKVLSDIESQMPAGHIYRDNDLVTWAHGTTHGINSRLRNSWRVPAAFYCLEGRAVAFTHPRLRKSHVAAMVPAEFRGTGFGLYMAGQSWDNEPLYILDEWLAYTNGAECGLDLAAAGRWSYGRRADTVEKMLEFNAYATHLMAAIDRYDPGYKDRQRLEAFIGWNILRTFALAEKAGKLPAFSSPKSTSMLAAFKRNYFATELVEAKRLALR